MADSNQYTTVNVYKDTFDLLKALSQFEKRAQVKVVEDALFLYCQTKKYA